MRCLACNKELSDFESTRKGSHTGEYIDLCNACYFYIQEDSPVIEREDLRGIQETIEEE